MLVRAGLGFGPGQPGPSPWPSPSASPSSLSALDTQGPRPGQQANPLHVSASQRGGQSPLHPPCPLPGQQQQQLQNERECVRRETQGGGWASQCQKIRGLGVQGLRPLCAPLASDSRPPRPAPPSSNPTAPPTQRWGRGKPLKRGPFFKRARWLFLSCPPAWRARSGAAGWKGELAAGAGP